MFSNLKRKQKNTDFTFNYHLSLSDIDDQWDDLMDERHHLQSQNLDFLENSTNIQGVYIEVYQHGVYVGNIYLQKVKIPISSLGISLKNFQKVECLLNSMQKMSCGVNFLVCGNIYRPNQEGYFFKNGISKEDVFEAFLDFIEAKEKEIGFAGILIKECSTPLNFAGKFIPIHRDVSMEMPINSAWNSIEDYIADLDKKYRKRFLKIQQAAIELNKKELNLEQIISFQKPMIELYNQVYSTQDFKLTEIKESYFIKLKESLGEKLKVFGFFKNNELLAFTTHIYNENQQMEIHYIGINYDYNKQYNLYFNILHFGLEKAILDKQKSIELGRTAQVAKASLGAVPSPNYNYVYFKKHIYSWSFQLFLKKMYNNIESEWQIRSPFATVVEV